MDWSDALLGGVMGVMTGIASMFGWFSGKLGKVHDRIDALHGHVHAHAVDLAELQANDLARVQRLERIEFGLDEINKKQDRQMVVLMDIRGRN
jgi:hypothetical protein